MYKDRKITLFAFASKDLKRSADRLKAQAKDTNYYDEIKILGPQDFDNKMTEKFNSLNKNDKKKGYGYWFWKPFFLKKIMDSGNVGEIVHYVDIGCHIQNKNTRFQDYMKILTKQDIWILPFQYFTDTNFSNDISFNQRYEYQFTKADLLDYFGFLNEKKITHTPQYWAGSFFLKNCEKTKNFLSEWISFFDEKFELINDSKSFLKNYDGFVENRHDQSVFSLLCKKYSIKSLSAYECEWGEKSNKRTWEHNSKNPILAKRDLKYNFVKRFLIRQKKNWNRFKRNFLNKS